MCISVDKLCPNRPILDENGRKRPLFCLFWLVFVIFECGGIPYQSTYFYHIFLPNPEMSYANFKTGERYRHIQIKENYRIGGQFLTTTLRQYKSHYVSI